MTDWNFVQQCGSNTPFEVAVTEEGTGDPVDLTGASAEWIFAKKDSQGRPIVPVLHLTSADSDLDLGGVTGIISGDLLPADTEDIAEGVEKVLVQHQLFLTLAGGQPMLVQKGEITFMSKLPTE